MRRQVIAAIVACCFLLTGTGVAPASASQPPAAAGSPCTPYGALRGSDAKQPATGDVATIGQLCLHDGSVATLERVPFSDSPGAAISEISLARDASLHPLTSIGTPDSASIDLRSRNGNWTHLFGGAVWRAPAITASGEIQALDKGHAQFSVAASLSYFAVVLPRFLARVKGTIFDVDFQPASATFSVSEGTVAVTRTTAIRLRDENRAIDGIRFTDIITATGPSSITYKLPLGIEREFQNQNEAQQALTKQLQDAIASGDAQAVDDAVYNLQVLTGQTIVGFAPHGTQTQAQNAAKTGTSSTTGNTIATGVAHISADTLAGLAAAVIGVTTGIVVSNERAAAATPAPAPVTGGVGLTSVHAVPTPSPTPPAHRK